jgi:hydrogenase maturation protease
LRIKTLTDAEKLEMRHVDEYARRILERTDTLDNEALLKMHGTMREPESAKEFDDFFGANAGTRLEEVSVAGVRLKAGDRVRLRPKARADAIDMVLAGQTAIVEALEEDLEKKVHVAVILENDPGKDLGMMRQPGHRFFYGVDEIEPLGAIAE